MRCNRPTGFPRNLLLAVLLVSVHSARLPAAEFRGPSELTRSIVDLSPHVLTDKERDEADGMIGRDLRRRRDAANVQNRAEWSAIKTRGQWETYRDVRIERLRKSLATFPAAPKEMKSKVTGTVEGDGFRIENIVYESRPGNWVTANLYVPAKPPKSMPGILIAHAHHRPKRQGEMQDMGMTWARAGCMVLVIDQVGYGERRAHPFNSSDDYAKEYRVSRQDYYYRYDSGIQLQLAGDSLMGWMTWDLSRGVDLLLSHEGIDPKRIIMLGAVAGGGDPCGITAALDDRIAAAVPFNFGGPQPETKYPLPEDAETSFNYLMGSYWESTRGLRRTAADGFFHWTITASIAPRRLIHGHEFSWDGERDPVWKRYQKIYGDFYNVPDNVDVAHGKGLLRGRPPEASHCTNIGRFHRKMIHPVFKRWFGIEVSPDDEYSSRRDYAELACWTDKARKDLQPASFVELVSAHGNRRATAAREKLEKLDATERREQLRQHWTELLGDIQLKSKPTVISTNGVAAPGKPNIERVVLEVEPDVIVPLLLISNGLKAKSPVVVALSQTGKEGFLKRRAQSVAGLVERGAIVCLPDLRGTGETKAGTLRGRGSGDGGRSVNMLMFDQTMVGQRLRDLKSVLAYLRSRKDVNAKQVSLWGDSFAPVNATDTNFKVPRAVDGRPQQSEPLGGLLALLGALFDDGIARVYVNGGLSGFQSVLEHYTVYIPHDVVVPGVLTTGDLCDFAASLAPRPLHLSNLIDGRNRRLSADAIKQIYEPAIKSYRDTFAENNLQISESTSPAQFLLSALPENLRVLPEEIDGLPTNRMFSRYLDRLADAALERRATEYEKIKTPEQVVQYQESMRSKFIEHLGGFPERTPLEARTVGKLEGDGYHVEKVIYESQPKHHVTAALFLPDAKPPFPAVLVPCGHSRSGKAANQRVCILLAKYGIAAMSYDPIGQSERVQLIDSEGKPRFKMTAEHTLIGAGCIPLGRNTATYRIWDGIRSIDYLTSRKDIDGTKIGVTGCSGGGTLTSYLMALDKRVVCAAPSCYITSWRRLLDTIGPQDAEQNIHGQLAFGMDHADYLMMRAPRPTLILASTRDFFDIDGAWDSFRQAKRCYTRLGFAERVNLVETDVKHGYPKLQREAMVRWMRRWLLGIDEPVTEPEFSTHSTADMQCTPKGQVLLMEGSRSVVDLNVELNQRLTTVRKTIWQQKNRENALSDVRQIAGIRKLADLPKPQINLVGQIERGDYHINKLDIQSEKGIRLPALMFIPRQKKGDLFLYLHDAGKETDAAIGGPIDRLVRAGNTVLAVDLRGIGETGGDSGGMWGGRWNDIFISYLVGKSIDGMRAEDVLSVARWFTTEDRSNRHSEIHLIAVGAAASPAIHAAALESDLFASLKLINSPPSWTELVRDPSTRGQLARTVHGALSVYDLPDLISAFRSTGKSATAVRREEQN